MTNWKYTNVTNTVVSRSLDNGGMESCLVSAIADWLSAGNVPTEADLVPAPTYQELRAAAYPPAGDQLGAMWEGGKAEAAMLELINAVKAEYPKT
jgi:hypothetical protein